MQKPQSSSLLAIFNLNLWSSERLSGVPSAAWNPNSNRSLLECSQQSFNWTIFLFWSLLKSFEIFRRLQRERGNLQESIWRFFQARILENMIIILWIKVLIIDARKHFNSVEHQLASMSRHSTFNWNRQNAVTVAQSQQAIICIRLFKKDEQIQFRACRKAHRPKVVKRVLTGRVTYWRISSRYLVDIRDLIGKRQTLRQVAITQRLDAPSDTLNSTLIVRAVWPTSSSLSKIFRNVTYGSQRVLRGFSKESQKVGHRNRVFNE